MTNRLKDIPIKDLEWSIQDSENAIEENEKEIELHQKSISEARAEIRRREIETFLTQHPEFTAREGDLFAITKEWHESHKWMEVVKLYYPIGSVCEVEEPFKTSKGEWVVGFTRHTTDRGLRGYHNSATMDEIMQMRTAYLVKESTPR